MIVHYPSGPATPVLPEGTDMPTISARAGEAWWVCDVKSCDAEVKLEEVALPSTCPNCGAGSQVSRFCPECGHHHPSHAVPDGWGTDDPEGDAAAGSAQFCSKHKSRIAEPVEDVPPVVEPAPEPPPGG